MFFGRDSGNDSAVDDDDGDHDDYSDDDDVDADDHLSLVFRIGRSRCTRLHWSSDPTCPFF